MKKIYLGALFINVCVFFAGKAAAQIVGDNVFLNGRYLEIGTGHLGYYGSDSSAPAGYHSHCSSCRVPLGIGFTADPAMDGWTTGAPPMMGDYFAPGSPYEGWELQVGSQRCQALNHGPSTTLDMTGGPMAVSGEISAYNTSGSKVIGLYQVTLDSLMLSQETTLDTNNLYFTVKITLQNLAYLPVNDIYYLRTLDPDNDASWLSIGGSFKTFNKIENQSVDTTIVSATGVSSTAPYLGLGTTYTNANCLIYQNWPLSDTINISRLYNGTYTDPGTRYTAGDTVTNDYALGLVFHIPHIASVDSAGDSVYRTTAGPGLHPANSATFSFFYSFSTAARNSAIAELLAATKSAIKDVNMESDVKVYPNPSKDQVNITNLSATDHILLYDMMGMNTGMNWVPAHDGTNTFRYNNLTPGAYILVVTDASGNIKTRVPVRKN